MKVFIGICILVMSLNLVYKCVLDREGNVDTIPLLEIYLKYYEVIIQLGVQGIEKYYAL